MKEEEGVEEQNELFEHHKFKADPKQDPLRIDKFLIDRVANISRNKIQEAAKNGCVLVNGESVKSNYKIRPNDEVTIVLEHPVREYDLSPENIPLDIVYEDDTVIVLNKQAGLVVHPGFGNFSGTLVNGLLYHFENLPDAKDGRPDRPGLVHRLDKNTSGIMVVAKTEEALTHLGKQFFDRTSSREYQALVWGDFDIDSGTITGNIGRSLKDRKIMAVFPEDEEYGKHAVTHWEVIERFGYVTLVKCKLETGRTHQIRAHFRHIKHPLFNDADYSGDKILKGTTFTKYKQFVQNCFDTIPRHALHAKSLGFTHPKTGEWMQFDSELPEDFFNVLEKWRGYAKNVL